VSNRTTGEVAYMIQCSLVNREATKGQAALAYCDALQLFDVASSFDEGPPEADCVASSR
jgi:hypothetical protein